MVIRGQSRLWVLRSAPALYFPGVGEGLPAQREKAQVIRTLTKRGHERLARADQNDSGARVLVARAAPLALLALQCPVLCQRRPALPFLSQARAILPALRASGCW